MQVEAGAGLALGLGDGFAAGLGEVLDGDGFGGNGVRVDDVGEGARLVVVAELGVLVVEVEEVVEELVVDGGAARSSAPAPHAASSGTRASQAAYPRLTPDRPALVTPAHRSKCW